MEYLFFIFFKTKLYMPQNSRYLIGNRLAVYEKLNINDRTSVWFHKKSTQVLQLIQKTNTAQQY